MSAIITLQLSDELYAAVQRTAQINDQTPDCRAAEARAGVVLADRPASDPGAGVAKAFSSG